MGDRVFCTQNQFPNVAQDINSFVRGFECIHYFLEDRVTFSSFETEPLGYYFTCPSSSTLGNPWDIVGTFPISVGHPNAFGAFFSHPRGTLNYGQASMIHGSQTRIAMIAVVSTTM